MRLPFDLPIHQHHGFVGRENLLDGLHRTFSRTASGTGHGAGQLGNIVVLHGLGGVGKTQLSVTYASTHRNEFDVIHWIDGTSKNNTLLSYQSLAQRLVNEAAQTSEDANAARRDLASRMRIGENILADGRVKADGDALNKLARAVVQFLESDTENFRWLLVIDNVDDLTSYPLGTFVPQSSRGRIIITTRLTEVTAYGLPIEVDQLELGTAVQILLNATKLRSKRPTGKSSLHSSANIAIGRYASRLLTITNTSR